MRDLPHVYKELRDRVRIHIKQIRKSEKKHPEYAVALLIAVASEALSRLQGQDDYTVFAKELLGRKHGVDELVGRGLFEAVRHGLAHRYDTSLITVGSSQVVVAISWQKPERHLQVRNKAWLRDGVRRDGINLDMDTMWRNLDGFLRQMTARLHRERKFAQLVRKRGHRLDQKYAVRAVKGQSQAVWRDTWEKFLSDRRLPAG